MASDFAVREFACDHTALAQLGWELGGCLGVAFLSAPGVSSCRCVSVDVYGELWCLAEGERADLVRWCLRRFLRIHHSLGLLVEAFRLGRCVGLVPPWAERVGIPLASLPVVVVDEEVEQSSDDGEG